MIEAVAVGGRAAGEVIGSAGGVDLLDQPHQQAAAFGMDALQGDHVEVRQHANQNIAHLMAGQLGIVQPFHVEGGDADKGTSRGGWRLVGRVLCRGRAASARAVPV